MVLLLYRLCGGVQGLLELLSTISFARFARFSYTVGMASLALLTSHRMTTQCLFIIEVIKLSG